MLWRTQRPAKRPGTIEPCIPTQVSKPPVGPHWIHEIKHDGYRLIARKRDGRVRLFTRRGFDWTERYPRIRDWRPRPLEERKAKLDKLLANARTGIQYSEHLEGDGAAIFAHACRLGAEGIVSKHREHPYRAGPSKAWLKTKNPAAPGMLRFQDRE
jgi:bifunctional non-homologous end joining protein LigD